MAALYRLSQKMLHCLQRFYQEKPALSMLDSAMLTREHFHLSLDEIKSPALDTYNNDSNFLSGGKERTELY